TFRNFKALAEWIGQNLKVENAVLDGEIACVDRSGRSVYQVGSKTIYQTTVNRSECTKVQANAQCVHCNERTRMACSSDGDEPVRPSRVTPGTRSNLRNLRQGI